MNITLKLEDERWQGFITNTLSALRSKDGLLKKALLVVWPREIKSHFDQEMGFEGAWAQWKSSTRQSRIAHEIRVTTASARARAAKNGVRPGGKLLQKSGRLRTETVLEPILTSTWGGLKVESPTPYSGFLDEGTKNMEARPFMWLGDEAQNNMAQAYTDMVFGAAD